MIGLKFGRLLVQKETAPYIHPSGQPARQFVAKCDCGAVVTVRGSSLRHGMTKSCGCYHSEEVTARLQRTDHPDMVGKTFGSLTVLRRATKRETAGRQACRWYEVLCACGSKKLVVGYAMRRGTTISCGCYAIERSTTHGHSKQGQRSAEYEAWCGMIKRCENPNRPDFPDYGGRGIKICKRWRGSFQLFLDDMGERPSPKHSIDRIKNDKGYSPSNCQWATSKQQANNRRKRRPST